ILEKLLWKS
ncbi:hypothetical protein CFC21_074007, partial [Triticum aestivum]